MAPVDLKIRYRIRVASIRISLRQGMHRGVRRDCAGGFASTQPAPSQGEVFHRKYFGPGGGDLSARRCGPAGWSAPCTME